MRGVGAVLAAAVLVAAFAPAEAQAPRPAPSGVRFQLAYGAAVLGVVTLGAVTLDGALMGPRYAVTATVETAGLAALMDDTRIRAAASGAVSGAALSWARYDLSHAYAKKFRRLAMARTAAGVSAVATPKYGDLGDPPASEAQKRASHDPLTALVTLGRLVGQTGRCAGRTLVFDGKAHYALTIAPLASGQYAGGGYLGPATVCRLTYDPIDGVRMSAAERARIPQGEIWFAAPVAGFAAPVRIEVPTPLGAARLDLKRYAVTAL